MPQPNRPAEPDGTESSPKHPVMTIALIGAVIFAFLSATLVIVVAVYHCLAFKSCTHLDGLSHVIMAWAGAIIAAVIGRLLGSRHIL